MIVQHLRELLDDIVNSERKLGVVARPRRLHDVPDVESLASRMQRDLIA